MIAQVRDVVQGLGLPADAAALIWSGLGAVMLYQKLRRNGKEATGNGSREVVAAIEKNRESIEHLARSLEAKVERDGDLTRAALAAAAAHNREAMRDAITVVAAQAAPRGVA